MYLRVLIRVLRCDTHDIKTRTISCIAVRVSCVAVWGGYGQSDRENHQSLLQNIVSFTGLFCRISSLSQGSFCQNMVYRDTEPRKVTATHENSHTRKRALHLERHQRHRHTATQHTPLPLSPTMSFALSISRTLALLRFCVLTLLLSRFLAFLHSRERWGAGVETHFQEIS